MGHRRLPFERPRPLQGGGRSRGDVERDAVEPKAATRKQRELERRRVPACPLVVAVCPSLETDEPPPDVEERERAEAGASCAVAASNSCERRQLDSKGRRLVKGRWRRSIPHGNRVTHGKLACARRARALAERGRACRWKRPACRFGRYRIRL